MKVLAIRGMGAVSPAGWGQPALLESLKRGEGVPETDLARPRWEFPLRVKRVPNPVDKPRVASHPRLRRASVISHFAAAAVSEALRSAPVEDPMWARSLGVIFCTTCGSVVYSRRFLDEVLVDPSRASPMLFPETVFNAPSSHLSAILGSTARNDTLIGDSGVFLQGLALAAQWLQDGSVASCLVVAAEELDWVTADAWRLFSPTRSLSEGAGALWLGWDEPVESQSRVERISSPQYYGPGRGHPLALKRVIAELGRVAPTEILATSEWAEDDPVGDESSLWGRQPRLRVRGLLGESFAATTAWQCIGALATARAVGKSQAVVVASGAYQEAIGARFALH